MNTITGWRLYGRQADRKFQIPQLYGCARESPGRNGTETIPMVARR